MAESMENLDHVSRTGGKDISIFAQTLILTKKNWMCKRRTELKKLVGELLLPVFYLIILSFLVKLNQHKVYPEVAQELDNQTNVLQSLVSSEERPNLICIVHSNYEKAEEIAKLMKMVWNTQTITPAAEEIMKFNFFNNSDELMDAYNSGHVKIAVVLSETDPFKYTIRIAPEFVDVIPLPSIKKKELDTCRGLDKRVGYLESYVTCPMNGYYYSNFLAIQYLVDHALIMKDLGKIDSNYKSPLIVIENYPKPEYSTGMQSFLRVIIPLYCIIPLAQLINTLLILVVTEKENKVKDGLKMIGVSDLAYWLSWFLIYGIMATFFAAMFTVVMHFMNVLTNINPVILFLLFMLFGFSIITFSFALTPFFHKPKTAGAVGTLVMQFTGTLFMLQTFLFSSTSGAIMPLRLLSSVAFTTAIDTACEYEYSGGITLNDLLPGEKGAGILYSLIFLVFDTIFYGIIAVYLDNVIPNEYGVSKHPLYFLSSSFWMGSGSEHSKNPVFDDDLEGIENQDSDDVEKVHPSMIGKEAFRIRNISKTYSSWFSKEKTEAVKNVSFDIYENQITALIGRNGAGKSTLFNMITGLVMPTSGRCVVFGLDISKPFDMMKLRKMTGVCMQQDLHFSELTVLEHLEFYGKLRGIHKTELHNEIDDLLQNLEISHQRKVRASKLSGGQKRKLSVAIALIGSPKIILLDEPSASIDPVSRRQLWSLLQKKKYGRVILLSTHFMDEADLLADRKGIIHNGILKCVGSSLFLKSRFGVGYQLTVELDETKMTSSAQIDSIIKKRMSESILKSRRIIANEAKYTLPHSEISKFPDLFKELELVIKSNSSNIKSYGISMTTLSEVFLKISNDMDLNDPNKKQEVMPHRRMSDGSLSSSNIELLGSNSNHNVEQGDNLIPNIGDVKANPVVTFFVLCILRYRRLIRNPQSLFFLVAMPVILVIIGFVLVKYNSNNANLNASLSFSAGNYTNIYSSSELDLAVAFNSEPSATEFLKSSGLDVFQYSGVFADLLHTNQPMGTMSALFANFSKKEVYLRLNGTYLHAPSLIMNAVNQYFFNQESASGKIITTVNQPLPSKSIVNFDQSTFYAVFLIGPAFTFSAVGMVMEIVNDREKHTRNHLRVNGVSFLSYFSSVFFVYGMLSLLITIFQVIVIIAFSIEAFTNPYALTVMVFLLILFIFPCLLFSAAFSYAFDRMETVQSVFSQVCSWMGSLFGIAIILIDLLAPASTMTWHTIFSFLDIFYIPFGIFYFVQKEYLKCSLLGYCDELSFKNYTGKEFTIMALGMLVQIPIYTFLILMGDVMKNGGTLGDVFNILKRTNASSTTPRRQASVSQSPTSSTLPHIDDEDVKNETARVDRYFESELDSSSKCVVAVQDLKKAYRKKSENKNGPNKKKYEMKKVLHGIDMLIEEGEVFGLLGHNGAGKTTTIRMIIAEEKPDSGKIRLCGNDIESNMSEAFSKLGYCPQHDAIWDNITLREHIELYATVRGVQKGIREKLVNHFLKGLQIEEHADKKANILSGGTKRKLSYCMAILGSPKIVLLDEPSTGMDIVSKRFLWNTVIGTFKDNRGAILTTHSMEEADALCSRLGILVKGSLLCIGSPQHLKTKFGVGYNLEIKLKLDETEFSSHENNLIDEQKFAFVLQHFPESSLNEIFENRAIYSIPKSSITSIAQTFFLLETLKAEHNIEEYAFSQTTLEQIYLQFAKNNEEEEEPSIS